LKDFKGSANTTIRVTVEDVDDNHPEFNLAVGQTYHLSIEEVSKI